MFLAGAATWSSLPQAVSKVVAAATPVNISRFLRNMVRLLENKVRFQINKQNSFTPINFLDQLNTNQFLLILKCIHKYQLGQINLQCLTNLPILKFAAVATAFCIFSPLEFEAFLKPLKEPVPCKPQSSS